MRKITIQKVAGMGLVSFLIVAGIMTAVAQKNYDDSRIPVQVQSVAQAERLELRRGTETEIQTDFMGFGTFQWELGSLAEGVSDTDQLIFYDENFNAFPCRILEKKVSEDGICRLWFQTEENVRLNGTYLAVLDFQGPLREYVYPAEVMPEGRDGTEGSIFVVYTREKIFGQEYYVKREDVLLYEYNEDKIALQTEPGGPVVIQSGQQLKNGDRVVLSGKEECNQKRESEERME